MLILSCDLVPLSIGTEDKDIKSWMPLTFFPKQKIQVNLNGTAEGIYRNTMYVSDRIENKNLKFKNPSFEEY